MENKMNCGEYRIDLGSGVNKPEGFIGIDVAGVKGIDIIRDVDKHGLPFCDNSVIVVRANSFFEHLENFIFVMNECWRVLRKGGYLKGKVPIAGSDAGFRNPTHKRFFTKNTFKYFDYLQARKYPMYETKPWEIVKIIEMKSRSGELSIIDFKMKPFK